MARRGRPDSGSGDGRGGDRPREKGSKLHAEGQHGEKTHARFIEQLHEGRRELPMDARVERRHVEAAFRGKRRLVEHREQHDEAEKNSERTRLAIEQVRATVPRLPAIPATMRAVAIDEFGPPGALGVRTMPVPRIGPRDVLIAVHTAGVGVWDAKIRDGTWAGGDERFPLVLGTDGAGIIAARGARVRRFEVADRVWAYAYAGPKGGFYAEYVVVSADQVGHVPRGLDLVQAGAGAVTALTALQGIDDHLALRSGETVLIFGASGAVGTLAIQFAKRRGAHVLATASGNDAEALVRQLGADSVVDGRHADVGVRLWELAPEGIDAVLVLAGGEGLERALDQVREGGRVAWPNGVEPEPRRRPALRCVAYDAVAGPREFERLERAVPEARLRVPIASTHRLADATLAHERVARGHVLGRIALRVSDDSDAMIPIDGS